MKKLDCFIIYQCIVSKHCDKQKQPILITDLQLRVLKKLNNAMIHNVLLIDDSPYKICPNHWSHAIHPPTFTPNPNIEDNYLLGPLLE